MREEKIDEVQPINPRSSVACTAVIGVAMTCPSVSKNQNDINSTPSANSVELENYIKDSSGPSHNSTPSAKPQGEWQEKKRSRIPTIVKEIVLIFFLAMLTNYLLGNPGDRIYHVFQSGSHNHVYQPGSQNTFCNINADELLEKIKNDGLN